ncbi:M24 family metallopeptidase [Thermocrinis minervae]|uniref:Xaa-Pro aminopeptidase/Xaa-Pro dipeptidase n=1 Tax=Thermocrinis minervae TaxID=381751 RepID=A0A1M6TC50_9AQUI|nr:Xaa-Pro peptidase family protein [Thermocrinis minervae]SHK54348.1 Xaa-Pro aminopeptidase/Xaa-Pro dipeptidase [Thermocrinis minervae]
MRKFQQIRERLKKENLDGFLFSSRASVEYLSGFRSTNAYCIATRDGSYLLTDSRYYHRALEELKGWNVVKIEKDTLKFIKGFVKDLGLKKVGYEKDRVSCHFKERLRAKSISWVGYEGFLKDLRAIKDKDEIERMRKGVELSDRIYLNLLEFLRPGLTELEVRAFLVHEFLKGGALGESFPAIVACGPASAIPHWETSTNRLEHGKPLLIDMGLVWEGYCTDFTRTIFLGKADEEFKRVYTVVRDAHLFALEEVKVGKRIGDVDRKAREYIQDKGFGDYFTHSTGHGVGVEIHEFPRVYKDGPDAEVPIEEGMVFTIEPGIYLPGKFGVRLENMVLVEGGSGKPLSSVSLDLVEL